MKSIAPIYLYVIFGIVGYTLSRYDGYSENVNDMQWYMVFLFTRLMEFSLILAIWKRPKTLTFIYKLSLLFITLATLFDTAATISAQRNQMNWKEHFSLAFVITLIVFLIALISNAKIGKWLKSPPKY